jgi:hypothetical protein
MNWTRLVLIVIGAGIVSSLTDWFFAGRLAPSAIPTLKFGERRRGQGDCSYQSTASFNLRHLCAYVIARLGLHSVAGSVKLAVAMWLIVTLPLILTNEEFMKLHRVFVASYATGRLVTLLIIAVATGCFLP